MSDISGQNDPTIDWASAPDQFRAAHDRNQARLAEMEQQLQTVTRENAARTAGIDVTTPIGTLWLNSYKGDMTPEAMRTNFDALGIPSAPPQGQQQAPPPVADDRPTPQELEEQRQRGAVHGQANPPGSEPTGNLWDQTYKDFHANMQSGMRRANAGAAALDRVFEAAMTPGHPQRDQAVFDSERFQEGR